MSGNGVLLGARLSAWCGAVAGTSAPATGELASGTTAITLMSKVEASALRGPSKLLIFLHFYPFARGIIKVE